MSKTLTNQNLKLLQTLHPSIDFLKEFKVENLPELATKAYFFVFNRGMILVRQQQTIDYIGVILEGKVTSGNQLKKGPGFVLGYYGLFNLLQKHAETITGDSEGIILAFRIDEFPRLSQQCRNIIMSYCTVKTLEHLKNRQINQQQWEEVSEKAASKYYSKDLKELLDNQIDQKEKLTLFSYFPWMKVKAKDLVINKDSSPYVLFLLRGELIVKGNAKKSLKTGDIYNGEGFLLNYSTNQNIYCLSDEAIILFINRRQFLNKMKSVTFHKLCNYLIREQINYNKYQIETYEKKKQKLQTNKKEWSPFVKATYQILPLNLPQGKGMRIEEDKKNKSNKVNSQKLMGIFFKNQMQDRKKLKTTSSVNSKLEKLITLKTEKNEQGEGSKDKELNDLKRDMENLQLKLKFYEDNYKSIKLELIEFKSKYLMVPVLKEIKGLSQNKNKSTSVPDQGNKVTLKQAFQEHMKANKINEVVARCAYKWLWAVRRKKKGFGSKKQQ